MQGEDFLCGDAVFVDDDISGEVADCAHGVCGHHALFLHAIYNVVVVFAGTVEFGGVDMYHQRLARGTFGRDAGTIGQPVVCMYDVKFLISGDFCRDLGVLVHLLHQILAVFSGENVFSFLPGRLEHTTFNLVDDIIVVV